MTREYDVVIIGGGVTGTAALYVLSLYSNVSSIAIIEKEEAVAKVNSHPKNNSQTLHFGDIETNLSDRKSAQCREAAGMIVNFIKRHHMAKLLYKKTHKMVLAVGADEVAELGQRFDAISKHYPNLRKAERKELLEIEPEIMRGRDPDCPVLALVSSDGVAVNYQVLSTCFLADSLSAHNSIDVLMGREVDLIERKGKGFLVHASGETLKAKTVLVAAGPYSLLFAQSMGYGQDLAFLPVAGSFYFSKIPLNGKVYTIQDPKLPFAAIHGDPEITLSGATRFGPTAKVIPLLERHKYRTMFRFLRTPIMSLAGLITVMRIARDKTVFGFMLKNMLYDLPVVGRWLFLRYARKVIPSLKLKDLRLGKGWGGLRPQIVNLKTHTLEEGESKIVRNGIIFNTTPSPGASVCLYNAERDAKEIVGFLGSPFSFDQERFDKDFRT